SGSGTNTSADLNEEVNPNYVGSIIPSFTQRSNDSYTVGLYVQGNEVIGDYSYLTDYVTANGDSVDVKDLSVEAEGEAFTAITAQATEDGKASTVNISNVDLNLHDDSDGSYGNDFSGLGTAIVSSGASETEHIRTNIDNSTIHTSGFARDAIIVNDYADTVITNSDITVEGNNALQSAGKVYDGYLFTALQSGMLSPPWILGITGGARGANLLGNYSSFTMIDSTFKSGGWAVVSTDGCTEPVMNIVNSTLEIAQADEFGQINGGSELFGYDYNYGSGYGTFAIGSSHENFYGATFKGVTMATIMSGCDLYYGASYSGLELSNGTGEALTTFDGEAEDTVVNGVFGIMDHSGGTATLDKGSVWNTEEAVLLAKGPSMGSKTTTFNVTGAELNPKSGVIMQAMDNDDGYGSGTFKSTQKSAYGTEWGMPTFNTGWTEKADAGVPDDVASKTSGGMIMTTLNLSDGTYTGDVFNGFGSGVDQAAHGVAVNISDSTIDGAISSTYAVHGLPYSDAAVEYLDKLAKEYGDGVSYQGEGDTPATVKYALLDANGKVTEDKTQAKYIQMLEFTMNEVYLIGHMINFQTTGATTEVTMTNASTWNVTKDSYITYLNVADGCTVNIADGVTLYIGGQAYTGTLTAGTYGAEHVPTDAEIEASQQKGFGDFMMGGDEGIGGIYGDGAGMPEGMAGGDMPSGDMPAGGAPGGDAAGGDDAAKPAELDLSHPVKLTVTKL
nr:hypothetical protein [Parasporobacterium sp.]